MNNVKSKIIILGSLIGGVCLDNDLQGQVNYYVKLIPVEPKRAAVSTLEHGLMVPPKTNDTNVILFSGYWIGALAARVSNILAQHGGSSKHVNGRVENEKRALITP